MSPAIGDIGDYANVEVDTFRGVANPSCDVVITWHRQQDRSDEPLRWISELPRD
jgi:hypothetical protein